MRLEPNDVHHAFRHHGDVHTIALTPRVVILDISGLIGDSLDAAYQFRTIHNAVPNLTEEGNPHGQTRA